MSLDHHTLTIGNDTLSLADWGVTAATLTQVAGVTGDSLRLSFVGRAFDAGYPIAPYQPVDLRDPSGARRFRGWLDDAPQSAAGENESQIIILRGPGLWLERIPARQKWKLSPTPGAYFLAGDLVELDVTRLILNQELETNQHRPVHEELDAFLAQSPFPYSLDNVPTAVEPPESEHNGVSLAQAIDHQLAWIPAIVPWWDYSGDDQPTLRFSDAGAGEVQTINPADGSTLAFTASPRHNLRVKTVRLHYLWEEAATQSDPGEPFFGQRRLWGKLVTDTATDPDSPSPWEIEETIELRPGRNEWSASSSTQSQEIEVAGVAGEPWLRRHLRFLDVAGVTLDGFDPGPGPDGGWDNELVRGSIPEWSNHTADRVTATVKVSYTQVRDEEEILKVVDEEHTITYVRTNAPVGASTLSSVTDVSAQFDYKQPEPLPVGLAQSLLNGYRQLWWDMRWSWVDTDVRWDVRPGQRWSAAMGSGGVTAAQTVSRQVVRDIDRGETTVETGSPRQLGLGEWLSLLRPTRLKETSHSWQFRREGKREDTATSGGGGGLTKGDKAAAAPGATNRTLGGIRLLRIGGEQGRAIELDPSQLPENWVMQAKAGTWLQLEGGTYSLEPIRALVAMEPDE